MSWFRRRPDAREPGRWYRAAFEKQQAINAVEATRVAASWAEWAAEQADLGHAWAAGEAAEAHVALIAQFARELGRRTAPDELRRHAGRMQGTAAEAGWWLGRAGRAAEAASVVETARAVMLSSRTQRLPADLGPRLTRLGRPELFDRYRRAEAELDVVERRRYEPGSSGPNCSSVMTPEQVTWSRFQEVRSEVAAVLGQVEPELAPTGSWPVAAGRLAYLAASRHGGYALLLDGSAVQSRTLPGVNAEVVAAWVARLRDLLDSGSTAQEWFSLLRDLGSVVRPVLSGLPGGADITLVPVGGLGVLPLHAAIVSAPGEALRYAGDVVAIRYAPNARLAIEAHRRIETATPGAVLAVGVNQPPGAGRALKYAEQEAESVRRRVEAFGGTCVRPRPATLSAVLDALTAAEVWHFACHGVADEEEPLNSAVLLADQPLLLRHLLGRPVSRHRLAVLSACQTNVPDEARLDEVIGFPGVLMRMGVGAVIASQWPVNDLAALRVMEFFYDDWLAGETPHRAFAAAVRHFRDSSTAVDQPWLWAAFTYTGA